MRRDLFHSSSWHLSFLSSGCNSNLCLFLSGPFITSWYLTLSIFRRLGNFHNTPWLECFWIFEEEGECWFISNDHFRREREGWELRSKWTNINVFIRPQLLCFIMQVFEIQSFVARDKNWMEVLVTVGVSSSGVEVYTISGGDLRCISCLPT